MYEGQEKRARISQQLVFHFTATERGMNKSFVQEFYLRLRWLNWTRYSARFISFIDLCKWSISQAQRENA